MTIGISNPPLGYSPDQPAGIATPESYGVHPTRYDIRLAVPLTCQERTRPIPTMRSGFSSFRSCGADAEVVAIRRDDPALAYGFCADHAAEAHGDNWRVFTLRKAAQAQQLLAALDAVAPLHNYGCGMDDALDDEWAVYDAALLVSGELLRRVAALEIAMGGWQSQA